MEGPWNDPGGLARRHAPAVYRLAYARTGSRADAEDVMQEVFLRLVKAGPDFDSEEHAKAWLLRVASNCANDLFRLPWRRRVPYPHPPVLLRGLLCGRDRQDPWEK